MSLTRRSVLKGIVAAGTASAATVTGIGPATAARAPKKAPADAVGLLYDATRCIGCKACVARCKEVNNLPPDPGGMRGLYDAPSDLNGRTKNIIKLYKGGDGRTSYVKKQCMHCIDPACASVCMIGAFQKRERGIVTWDINRCIGCRNCMVACSFNVPRFEWDTPFPKLVKCEMCNKRIAEGKRPGCVEACPREGVIFGRYSDLLADAKGRIAREPGRYFPKVYGENDVGGTQVLYLSAADVSFEKLGFPDMGTQPVPALSETIQHGIYQGFIAPFALYAVLGVVLYRNRMSIRGEEGNDEP